MPEVNLLAVLVASVMAFGLSGLCYATLGARMAALHPAYAEAGRPTGLTALVEMVRNLVLGLVTAGLVERADVSGLGGGLLLGLVLWIGFPVVLLAGSVVHERVPPALAAIHAGDWLLTLFAIAGLLAVWQ